MTKTRTTAWTLTAHKKYLTIAHDNYLLAQNLYAECSAMHVKYKQGAAKSDADAALITEKIEEQERYASVAVIFTALSLEAYINYYGITRLSKSYFTKYIDKLSLVAKWVLLPRLTCGKQLGVESKAIEDLRWLATLRNKMVHYKAREVASNGLSASDVLWKSDAEKALKTAANIVRALKKLDPKVETELQFKNLALPEVPK